MARKTTPSQYLATLTPTSRREVRRLREIIKGAAPDAEETISYGILGFRLDGRVLVYCAGWKDFTSMYPITPGMRAAGGDAMTKFVAGKGTLRFPIEKALPAALVRRLVKARANELRGR